MRKLALVAALAAFAALPACTTFNPQRRTLTDWSVAQLKEPADPCGTMSYDPEPKAGEKDACGGKTIFHGMTGRKVVNWVFVKPIELVMVPVSWLGDTLILNPIDGWKKAELDTYERRFCKAEAAGDEWSDAHAAHHAYGVIPVATPWVVSDLLAAPEFAARWIWNSVSPADPVNTDAYNAYWREHNETTGQ